MSVRKKITRLDKKGYEQVYEMLILRSIGWPYLRIAAYYKKDHTTIMYHCKKYNVTIGTPLDAIFVPEEVDKQQYWELRIEAVQDYKYRPLIEEPINRGKLSYEDYLKEDRLRKQAASSRQPQKSL